MRSPLAAPVRFSFVVHGCCHLALIPRPALLKDECRVYANGNVAILFVSTSKDRHHYVRARFWMALLLMATLWDVWG